VLILKQAASGLACDFFGIVEERDRWQSNRRKSCWQTTTTGSFQQAYTILVPYWTVHALHREPKVVRGISCNWGPVWSSSDFFTASHDSAGCGLPQAPFPLSSSETHEKMTFGVPSVFLMNRSPGWTNPFSYPLLGVVVSSMILSSFSFFTRLFDGFPRSSNDSPHVFFVLAAMSGYSAQTPYILNPCSSISSRSESNTLR